MTLIQEAPLLAPYLQETPEMDFQHFLIRRTLKHLVKSTDTEEIKIRHLFEFVRDQIAHSWDVQSSRITRTASEVLLFREGICYAKSNLLAALCRGSGIPAGFCYQRITLGDTPESGYCIHALNAVYLKKHNRWIRLDARGNKEGIQAEFSVTHEKLAFMIRSEIHEKEDPVIYCNPLPVTMRVLQQYSDGLKMYAHGLPDFKNQNSPL